MRGSGCTSQAKEEVTVVTAFQITVFIAKIRKDVAAADSPTICLSLAPCSPCCCTRNWIVICSMQELFHHFVQSPDPRSANEKDIASGQDTGMNSTGFLLKITEDRSNGEVSCAMCEFPKLQKTEKHKKHKSRHLRF